MLPDDHWDGKKFHNPGGANGQGGQLAGLGQVLRWRLTARRIPWPTRLTDVQLPVLPPVGANQLAVTFIGHDTFLLQYPDGLNVLTDPIWSERASPFSFLGPARVRPAALPFEQLPPIQVVLISHNHYDHLDRPTLRRLSREHRPTVVVPLGNRKTIAELDCPVVELDWWEEWVRPGLRVTLTPAQHWSNRGIDRNRALWGGFWLRTASPSLYFAGDTGYSQPLFQGIRQRLGAPDVSLLPVGTYEPRWFMHKQHMNPHDAVRAHLDLESRRSIGMHFGTFHLSDEAIEDPLRGMEQALELHGVRPDLFPVPGFGQTFLLP